MILAYLLFLLLHIVATTYFYVFGIHTSILNYAYNILITLFVIAPFIQGFFLNFKYPKLKPIVIPLQISNLFFASALYIWFYFNVTGQEIPYPSLADLFFVLYYPVNIISLFYLAKKSGVVWSISSIINIFLIFIVLAGISVVFISDQPIDFNQPILVVILNLIYPVLDSLLVSIGVTILRAQKNNQYRYFFYYIFGYVFLLFADNLFAYQTNNEIYWNGNVVDLLYGVAHMCIALGTNYLPTMATKTEED